MRWTKTKTLLADRNETKKNSSPAGENGNNLMGAVSGTKCPHAGVQEGPPDAANVRGRVSSTFASNSRSNWAAEILA